jgi:hypothetical protein
VRRGAERHCRIDGRYRAVTRRLLQSKCVMPPGRLLIALAVSSTTLTACGSSSNPSSSSIPSGSGSVLTQAVKFAHCMRSNGVKNYPDPSSGGGLQPLNRIDPNSPTFTTAFEACRKDLTGGGAGGPPVPSAAQLRFALAFAKCIRKHGFPQFPDPLTTYGPGFTLGRGEYFPNISTNELQSSAFTHAAKACGVQPPSGTP